MWCGWSQAYVAEILGSDPKSVGRWERGEVFPSPYHRYKLLELFERNAQEMGLIEDNSDDRGKDYCQVTAWFFINYLFTYNS